MIKTIKNEGKAAVFAGPGEAVDGLRAEIYQHDKPDAEGKRDQRISTPTFKIFTI